MRITDNHLLPHFKGFFLIYFKTIFVFNIFSLWENTSTYRKHAMSEDNFVVSGLSFQTSVGSGD